MRKRNFTIKELLAATAAMAVGIALWTVIPPEYGLLRLAGFLPGVFFIVLAIGLLIDDRPGKLALRVVVGALVGLLLLALILGMAIRLM